MTLNRLTACRAALSSAIKDAFSSVPAYIDGDTVTKPADLYLEIRYAGSETDDVDNTELQLNVNVISVPRTGTNVYRYIDLANQIHDLLCNLGVSVTGVGCLTRSGPVRVADLGYVNPEKTIQQATVSCTFLLEI